MFTYPTPETARPFWRDMPGNEAEASLYLEVAKGQCLAYAPLPAEPAPTYTPFVYADDVVTITFSREGDIVTADVVTTGDYHPILRKNIPAEYQWTEAIATVYGYNYETGYNLNFEPTAYIAFYDTTVVRWIGEPAEATGPVEIPANYFAAIITQARNLFNAGASPVQGGDFDGSGYGVTTFPLDWTVKQLLRPELGLGAIA